MENKKNDTCVMCGKEVTNNDHILMSRIGEFKCCSIDCLIRLDYIWDKALENFNVALKTSKGKCEVCGNDIVGQVYTYEGLFNSYLCCSKRCLQEFADSRNSKKLATK